MPFTPLEQRASVRKMLMPPLLIGMTTLLALIGIGLYGQYITYYKRQVASTHEAAVRLYSYAVQDSEATMGGLLEVFTGDRRIIPLLREGDAQSLQTLYRHVFLGLYKRSSIAYLAFVGRDKRTILRMHDPRYFGDSVERSILSEAEETRRAVAGLDVGGNGLLTLRMVAPVSDDNNEIVGFVETAVEMDSVIASSVQGQHLQLAFLLRKDKQATDLILQGSAKKYQAGFWRDMDADSLLYTSMLGFDKEFLGKIREQQRELKNNNSLERISFFHNKEYYVLSVLPLADSLGNATGELFVIESATGMWYEYLTTALILFGFGLAVMFACHRLAARKLASTDKHIAEMVAKIHEGDLILGNVFEESETGFVLQNWTTGEVLRANRVALSIFGVYAADEIDVGLLMPLPQKDPMQQSWQASQASRPLMSISTSNGVTYCETDQFFIGAKEEIQCLAIRDVTKVVLLQSENRAQIQYLQTIIDQLPGMVFIKDEEFCLILYNSAFERAVGNQDNMIGEQYFAPWIGLTIEEMSEDDRHVFNSGQPYIFEGSLLQNDGEEHTYVVTKQLITDKRGEKLLLCVGTDITERTRMEKQLIALKEKADAANLAKSQFLAHMSHEIRTPMNVILGMSHLALNADPDERQRNYLTKIHGAAKNLLGIINDILDFSKIEAGEMHLEHIPFSLNELLLDIQSGSQTLLMDKPVRFILDAPDFEGDFLGDPLRLRQVLLNLVNNAIKFTERGHVALICVILKKHDDYHDLQFAVEDTGIGIPEDALPRLFSSFQQVDGTTTRKFGGTGLGLAISQQFVNIMGGRIVVHSQFGSGSTFSFTITLQMVVPEAGERALPGVAAAWDGYSPAPETDPALAEKQTSPALPGLLATARVLVVEDNAINQEIIVEMLSSYGLAVRAVDNGLEAVGALKEEQFSLVLMDLQMPVMDGLTATRAIRSLSDNPASEVPVIALTANAMHEDRARCLEAGMNDFLSKPIDVRELEAKLHQWLSRNADES
ncbi:response regulator [Desulfovibrio sp. OttesenSCG-928-A18]|nr:response regulator [Desulfovibrio sp. OttesenSCG-928-A18]